MRLAATLAAALLAWTAPGAAAAPSVPAVPAETAAPLEQPITANFQDVEFTSAMSFLAESAGVNVILSETTRSVAKPVTVHFAGMPFRRALEYLVQGQGLLYRQEGTAIWVATREEMESEPMETRVFSLKQGPGLFAAFQPFSETRDSMALQSSAIETVTTLKDILSEVIPQVGSSSLLLDQRSGALIVTHVPYYLQQVERLLEELDITPQQVLIEARFVEVTQTNTKEWGFDVDLTGNATLIKGKSNDSTRAAQVQLAKTGPTLARGTQTNFSDFTNQTSGNALNLTLQGILTGTQYAAVLHALAQNDKTRTLSAPRVATLNNQTATIKVVTEFVYATRYEASVKRVDLNSDGDFEDVSSAGVRETRFINVPQDFVTKDLGILLHVTPSIGQDQRTITLALRPEVSEKKTDDSFGGEVTLPRFTTRNLETSVVVENGETVMLGGLMKDTTSKTSTRVPVLGRLPIVGPLFRKDNESVERSNLLIFVTAQLVHPSGAHLVARED